VQAKTGNIQSKRLKSRGCHTDSNHPWWNTSLHQYNPSDEDSNDSDWLPDTIEQLILHLAPVSQSGFPFKQTKYLVLEKQLLELIKFCRI